MEVGLHSSFGNPVSEGGTASPRAITLNLVCGGFGLGIFSLPWSTAGASLLPGLLIIALTVALNAWTVSILVEGAERYQAFDLGALLSNLPSRISGPVQLATNVAVWITLWGSQVGYIDVLTDALMEILPSIQRPLGVLLSSTLVLPLCFLDQRYLNFTSALAVVVNAYIFVVMALQPAKGQAGVCLVGDGRGDISMVSVMMMAIVIQMCVLPMYKELEDRSPARFGRAVLSGFSGLAAIFGTFAAVGYLRFGSDVQGNILDSLPHTAWGNVARVGAGLAVGCVYPIFLQSMVAPFWNMAGPWRSATAAAATVVTVALTGLGALFVRNVSLVNTFDGAFCAVVFVAALPGLVGLQLLDRRSLAWRASMVALIIFGVVSGVLGMAFTQNYPQELRRHCAWRLR